MNISNIIADRGIRELLHFTTNHGCLGTLYSFALKSRAGLEGDRMVEYLFKPNAQLRKDVNHLNMVNFSIAHINSHFFRISSQNWHQGDDIFWVILSFAPEIACHPGVIFSTTNNMYTGVQRSAGPEGLVALFADPITRWAGNVVRRRPALDRGWPTCEQAEVLYPEEVSTRFLRRIYTRTEAERAEVIGFLRATWHDEVDVIVAPERFAGRPS
jgi:hypothetical protein